MNRSPILAAAALALLVSTSALAQTEGDRVAARQLALEGREALERSDFATAADRFARADKLVHAPTLSLDLGRAQAGLGKLVLALEIWNRIGREGAPPDSPPSWQQAVTDAEVEAKRMLARVPKVTVSVAGAPGAAVTIDGERVPEASFGVERPVDPGAHQLEATAPGMAPYRESFEVKEAQHKTLAIALVPDASAASSGPSAALSGPSAAPSAQPGSTQRALGVAALAVGGAGVVTWGVAGVVAYAKQSMLSADGCKETSCPASTAGGRPAFEAARTASTVGFYVGLVGAGAGVVLVLTAPRAPAASTGSIAPWIGAGMAGVTGSF